MDSDHHQDRDAAHGVDDAVAAGRLRAGVRYRNPVHRWSRRHGHLAVSRREIAGTATDGVTRRAKATPRLKPGSARKAPPLLIQSAQGAVPANPAYRLLASAGSTNKAMINALRRAVIAATIGKRR